MIDFCEFFVHLQMTDQFYIVKLITDTPELRDQLLIIPHTWIEVAKTAQDIKIFAYYPPPPYDSNSLKTIGELCSTLSKPNKKWIKADVILEESASKYNDF